MKTKIKTEMKYSKMTSKETLEELMGRINRCFPKDRYKWSADPVVLMVQQAQQRGEICVIGIIERLIYDIEDEIKSTRKKSKPFVKKKSNSKKSEPKFLTTEAIDKW